MGEIIARNIFSWLKLLIKLSLLHLVGCLYYCTNDARWQKHETGLPLEMTNSATDYENGNRYDGECELPQRLRHAILQHQTKTLPEFRLSPSSAILKKKKSEMLTVSRRVHKLSLGGMKTQWDEGGGRILLGDNTGGEAVSLRPISFQCEGVWIFLTQVCIA